MLPDRAAIDGFADATLPETSAVIRRAPVLVAACVRLADGITVGDRAYDLYDVGSAVQNLLLAATDLGLASGVGGDRGLQGDLDADPPADDADHRIPDRRDELAAIPTIAPPPAQG